MGASRREVPAAAAGTRLDGWLAEWLDSRGAAQKAIESGRVTVDGARRAKSFRLEGGETVAVAPAPAEPEAPPAEFEIRYEDEHLLVVDKPARVVVHPAHGHATGTLVQALGDRVAGGEDPARPGIVHRLDRDTSGLLVVARSEEVHATLKRAIKARKIVREYLALVHGVPESLSGTIDAPIGRHRRDRIRMSTETDEPREARTHFEVDQAFEAHTLLRVSLETGRTHQIRVHLQAIGLPVAGDREYGGAHGELGLYRQFLHAARLAFPHPVTGEPLDVSSPLPPDLQAALARASRA